MKKEDLFLSLLLSWGVIREEKSFGIEKTLKNCMYVHTVFETQTKRVHICAILVSLNNNNKRAPAAFCGVWTIVPGILQVVDPGIQSDIKSRAKGKRARALKHFKKKRKSDISHLFMHMGYLIKLPSVKLANLQWKMIFNYCSNGFCFKWRLS